MVKSTFFSVKSRFFMVNIGELTISDPTAAPLRLADFGGRHGPVAEAFEAAPHLAQGLGIALVDQVFKILGEDGLVGGFNNLDFFVNGKDCPIYHGK